MTTQIEHTCRSDSLGVGLGMGKIGIHVLGLEALLSSKNRAEKRAISRSGGDLNVLRYRQNDHIFSQTVIRFYLAKIVCALEHLHSMGIAYRDLKPENMLIQQSGHVTLTNFDLSRSLKHLHSQRSATNTAGTSRAGSILALSLFALYFLQSISKNKKEKQHKTPKVLATKAREPSSRDGSFLSPQSLKRSQIKRKSYQNLARPIGRELARLRIKKDNWTSNPSATNLGRDDFEANSRKPSFSDNGERANSFVGTEEYVSPEVVRGEGHEFTVDWWALGILTYECLYGTTPFKGKSRKETFRNVLTKTPELEDEVVGRRVGSEYLEWNQTQKKKEKGIFLWREKKR
ncbi:serine/threonine-protein kinase UCNL-like [Rosa rugosa]|uniref:serine/threonine-protein kinase UCNL-like n=1 Tax=Rosa rugosa TaxID=74645 RepID=UPI002B41470E|nr:serine/threonine-protein kinase UCNL-like [Rosa rugosa]